jgi:formamidopyrimidine-DNA glycosylase
MPEFPEVEAYRQLAEVLLGRTVVAVDAPDHWYLKGGIDESVLKEALVGRSVEEVRRKGKRLFVDLVDEEGAVTLGLRFGMTGRLIVDGVPGIEGVLYSSHRDNPAWDRFGLDFERGGRAVVRDPRRLGGVELDPDESRLGPDVTDIGLAQLSRGLGSSTAPVKSCLLDQSRLAGVGNLMGDEVLWRAGIDPRRAAASLGYAELRRLHRHLLATSEALLDRGGVHLGDLLSDRHEGGRCSRDGEPLAHAKVGGRTTYWCPRHQV